MYKAANTWGPPFQCSATGQCSNSFTFLFMYIIIIIVWILCLWTGTYRDEAAPLFVGTTLAVFALGSVTAYGVWRSVEFIIHVFEFTIAIFPSFQQQILQSQKSAIRSDGVRSFNECTSIIRLQLMKSLECPPFRYTYGMYPTLKTYDTIQSNMEWKWKTWYMSWIS